LNGTLKTTKLTNTFFQKHFTITPTELPN
jgi:hypothetical protein